VRKDLLVPDFRERPDRHEEDNIVFDLHEVDDESDPNPKEENCRDVERGNDEPESEKSCSSFHQHIIVTYFLRFHKSPCLSQT